MDFILDLPRSKCKDAIFVVVNRITKYAHCCGIQSTHIARKVTYVFMKEIHRLHGCPKVIVRERVLKFARIFWKDLRKIK